MLDTQENKVGMYLKTHSYLIETDNLHNTVPLIGEANVELREMIDSIFNKAAIADADITGTAKVKANKRAETKLQIKKIAGALNLIGASTGDLTLAEKVDATDAQLDAMRDSEFYKYGQIVATLATEKSAALIPLDIPTAVINALKSLNEVYLMMIDDPKSAAEKQKNMRQSMVLDFEKVDAFLDEKLDRYMRVFEASQPDLYRGYGLARSIDDTGASTTPDFEDEVAIGATKAIGTSNYVASRTFKIKNSGNVPLTFYLTNDINEQQGATLLVQPNESRTKNTAFFNADNSAFNLMVVNPSDAEAGRYKVYLQE